ncbi:glycosyltransferase [Erythrobacter sp. 3-20A1M]|uniref:glycosyltransferase family 2 protein n=1 Tax=Erythrobacter sp. 3-20A1M TaxID=2653850 RepID=UPI001BFC230C|nr:glycosyltransferase family 2 protein [Erythrobacter sp. 3-20A1M]QWC58300.1 glycosyltransferase [Erythrobacter sp. 3-20A1M]
MQPEISVIIPHYQDLEALDKCLEALRLQTITPAREFEIIVADNNSPVGLEAVAEVVGDRARVVVAMDKGAGPARNAGIGAARGSLLAFTDSDCVPEPGWLEAGLSRLNDFDLVGGRVVVLVEHESRMNGVEAFERVFAFNNARYVAEEGFTGAGNLFCRAETAATIGPFEAVVSEDKEWCKRATKLGFTLGYAHDAVVGHPARTNWRDFLQKWKRINRESYALWRAEGKSVAGWLGRTWLLPASIGPHAVKVLTSKSLSGTGNRARAFGTLAAQRIWRFWDQQRLIFTSKR